MKALSRLWLVGLIAGTAFAQPALHLKGQKRQRPFATRLSDSAPKTRTAGRSHLMVQFADNPSDGQLTELQNRGAALLSYVPDFALSISANDDTAYDGLDLQWIGRLEPGEKISTELDESLMAGGTLSVLVEFYGDVDPSDARVIANDTGLLIRENPDLRANHLLVSGSSDQLLDLATWDEVAYIFLVSPELLQGTPVRGCAGALTSLGQVTQAVPLVGDGWDGPGRGGADLKYSFVRMTEKLPADSAKAEIVRAFSEWAKYAKLTFTPTDNANGNRTIAVLFASGDHGDGYPFDGPGGTVAHTFYPFPVNWEPQAGDMHLDNDENWRIGSTVDLFSIALHETGHALGLGHSDRPGDVMYPYYRKVTGLTQDDISAVLQLYAAQAATQPATPASPLTLTVHAPSITTTASSIAVNGTTAGGTGGVQVSWSTDHGASGTAQGSANWTIAGIPLSVGDNVITITARDSQQGQASRSLTVTRQQSDPATPASPLTLSLQAPASPTTGSTIAMSGTASGGTGGVQVSWSTNHGASGAAKGSANWTVAGIPLSVGDNVITITARDSQQGQATRSVTVTRQQTNPPPPPSGPDTTPPTLTIVSPSTSNLATSNSSLVVSGTAYDNVGVASVTWTSSTGGSGTASGTDNWTTSPIALYVGTTTITIRASDAAGNTTWRSITVTRR